MNLLICLPHEVVENGEWELSAQDMECLAIGAGIPGYGGGGDLNKGYKAKSSKNGKQLKCDS